MSRLSRPDVVSWLRPRDGDDGRAGLVHYSPGLVPTVEGILCVRGGERLPYVGTVVSTTELVGLVNCPGCLEWMHA